MNDADRILLEIDLGRTTESAKEAAKAVDTLAAAVKKTADSYELLEKETKEYTLAVTQVDAAMDKEVAAAVEATRAHRFYAQVLDEHKAKLAGVTTTTNAAIGTTGRGGFGLMGISYAVQDFTSQINNGLVPALGAVQNNVPMIVQSLGMNAGLAAGISLVSVGLGVAIPLVTKLGGGVGEAGEKADDGTKKLTGFNEQLKKLIDLGRQLQEEKTKPEAAVAKATKEAIGEAGEQAIRAGLERNLQEQDEAALAAEVQRRVSTPEAKERIRLGGAVERAELEKQARAGASQEARETRGPRVAAIMGALASGDEGTRLMVERMARARPDTFGKDTADALARASPQARQAEADIRARNAAAAFGAQVDFDEMEFARILPDTPPPFFNRRLPVGRIDQGPLAAGERAAVETPAQRRARLIAQLQARPKPNVIGPQGEPEFQSQVYAPKYRPRPTRELGRDEDRAREAFQRDAAAATLRQTSRAMGAMTTTNAMVAGTLAQVQLELKRVADENARLQRQMRQRQPAGMRRAFPG